MHAAFTTSVNIKLKSKENEGLVYRVAAIIH